MLIHAVAAVEASQRRISWCTWSMLGVIIACFALERLCGWSVHHHGPVPTELALRLVEAAADGRIYQDPMFFQPWQPWTQVLLQNDWWQLVAGVVVLAMAGAALEAALGWAALLSACLAILPVSALGAVVFGGEPAVTGLNVGLLAMLLARSPRLEVRWVLSYYAIAEVGQLRLFSMPLSWLAWAYLIQELLRLHLANLPAPLGAWVLAAAAGATLGVTSRWIRPVA